MTLRLTIATPAELLIDRLPVRVVRGEDESGSFGVMAGHANLLTMAAQAILRWSEMDGRRRFCAVQGALIAVSGGVTFRVSAREALIGDRLDMLEAQVKAMRLRASETAKQERVAATELHARAVRRLVSHLQASDRDEAYP
jgi:F-type H+-transporting ATPase subunit epsilon